MNTAFRDGFQSAFGARVFTRDFIPAVEAAREAGITHYEAGGGARFQSLYFYCNEDAFDMMDAFREAAGPDADLQTLARGINVVGLDSQPRDIIELHAKLFKKHGITTIRNFDALNDVNNLIYSGKCIVDAGLRHEPCVTLMSLPPGVEGGHTSEFYLGILREILDAEIPYHSVCFKDASGTAVPQVVYDTIRAARRLLGDDRHISFHTHETAGISVSAYRAALDAGADQIDLSLTPVSGGTCQPDIITMWHALRGTEFELDIDVNKVLEAEEVFRECMRDYEMFPEAIAVEPLIAFSPMPGGALTANTQMMRDNNMLDKYDAVIRAMGEAIEKGGFGTSVTPVSQFYFQQAFNNVMLGPWKKIADGYGKMVLGYFGKTPLPPDPEVVKIAAEQLELEPTTESPLDINGRDPAKGVEAARAELRKNGIEETDENIFIAATCKDKGIQYLKGEGRLGVRKKEPEQEREDLVGAGGTGGGGGAAPAAATSGSGTASQYQVRLNDRTYTVEISQGRARVNGRNYELAVQPVEPGDGSPSAPPQAAAQPATAQPAAASGNAPQKAATEPVAVEAPMAGLVLRLNVAVGHEVTAGDQLLVLEAMKMEAPVTAPVTGRVSEVLVNTGDNVQSGRVLLRIEG